MYGWCQFCIPLAHTHSPTTHTHIDILSAVRRFNQIEEKIHNNENLALESGLWAAVALSYAHTIHHHYPYVYLDRCKLFVGGFRMAHKTYGMYVIIHCIYIFDSNTHKHLPKPTIASRIISDRVLRHIFGTAKKPAAALEWYNMVPQHSTHTMLHHITLLYQPHLYIPRLATGNSFGSLISRQSSPSNTLNVY